jgi:hypothetical protein
MGKFQAFWDEKELSWTQQVKSRWLDLGLDGKAGRDEGTRERGNEKIREQGTGAGINC